MLNRQSNLPRLCLALALACAALLGCDAERGRSVHVASPATNNDELMALAQKDQVALLEKCQKNFESMDVTDYTCLLRRQERLGGFLHPAQEVEVKFRAEPFSVAMAWIENPGDGDRCLYVAGDWPDRDGISQMIIRPTSGLVQMLYSSSVFRVPDHKEVMQGTRKPITQFGFHVAVAPWAVVPGPRRQRGCGYLRRGSASAAGSRRRSPR